MSAERDKTQGFSFVYGNLKDAYDKLLLETKKLLIPKIKKISTKKKKK